MSIRDLAKNFPLASHPDLRETFADSVGSTFFDGTSMRVEFTVARFNEPKTGQTTPPTGERHVVCRLAMTPHAAVDLFNGLNQMMAVLAKEGIIKMEGGKPVATTKPH